MTYSQTVAKAFLLFNTFLLVPATFAMLFVVAIIIIMLFSGQMEMAAMSLLPLFVYIFAVTLNIGYSRHLTNKLLEYKIVPLWVGTIILNLGFLVAMGSNFEFSTNFYDLPEVTQHWFGKLYLSIMIWHLVAVLFSIAAIASRIKSPRIFN